MSIKLKKELQGKILDVGGGGEGIIGQLYGKQVTAIDNNQDELDESPDCFEKIFMDATKMTFEDNSFDNATFFYSLMFMNKTEQCKALSEAARAVRIGGEVHIWDCNIEKAYPEPFCVNVNVSLPNKRIKTTYGVGKLDAQNFQMIKEMCEAVGLIIEATQAEHKNFYIKCVKADGIL